MNDRSALGDVWNSIDEDIQNEIRNAWAAIIRYYL